MILIIDTSSKKSLVARVLKNEIKKSIWQADFRHSEKLLPEISKILGDKTRTLKGVIVISGPGSFTGLRVGVAVANTFGFSLNIPVVGINKVEWLSCCGFNQSQIAGIINNHSDGQGQDINLYNNKNIKILIDLGSEKFKKNKKGEIVSPFYNRTPNITYGKRKF